MGKLKRANESSPETGTATKKNAAVWVWENLNYHQKNWFIRCRFLVDHFKKKQVQKFHQESAFKPRTHNRIHNPTDYIHFPLYWEFDVLDIYIYMYMYHIYIY